MSQISNKRENKHECNQLAENKYLVEKTKCYQLTEIAKAAEAVLKLKNQTGEFSPSKTEGKSRKSILVF